MSYIDSEKLGLSLEELLNHGLMSGLYTGASAVLFWKQGSEWIRNVVHVGRHDTDPRSRRVDGNSIYDLASMTKALSTSFMVHGFVHEGTISLDTLITEVLPWTETMFPWGPASVGHLLSHWSGLPAYESLHRMAASRVEAMVRLTGVRAQFPLGRGVTYSDIGYILLGFMLSELDSAWAGSFLDRVESVTDGLTFWPVHPALLVSNDDPSSPVARGWVHDENARLLGPSAGHAGLFGTAEGVTDFLEALVDSYHGEGPFHRNLVRSMWTRVNDRFTYGWDTPTGAASTAGNLPPASTMGHLGFTGTSMWVDPISRRGVVLLTNRVRMGRFHPRINHLRRAISLLLDRVDQAAQV